MSKRYIIRRTGILHIEYLAEKNPAHDLRAVWEVHRSAAALFETEEEAIKAARLVNGWVEASKRK